MRSRSVEGVAGGGRGRGRHVGRPDVINAHTPVPFMVDMVTWAAGRLPVVITYHAATLLKPGSAMMSLLIRGCGGLAGCRGRCSPRWCGAGTSARLLSPCPGWDTSRLVMMKL